MREMMMGARQSLLKRLQVNVSVLDTSLFANVARHSISMSLIFADLSSEQ